VFEVEKSRVMLFSGFQRVTMKMLPGDADADGEVQASEKVVKYSVFPLEGGFVPLPRARVTIQRGDGDPTLTVVDDVHGPPSVFVKNVDIDKGMPPSPEPDSQPTSPPPELATEEVPLGGDDQGGAPVSDGGGGAKASGGEDGEVKADVKASGEGGAVDNVETKASAEVEEVSNNNDGNNNDEDGGDDGDLGAGDLGA
jgi:hypothetical protein